MSVWLIVLMAWFGGSMLLAVLVGKMIAFGDRGAAATQLEPAMSDDRPIASLDPLLAG